MQGASALQTALQGFPERELRVFVVWERVIATDLTRPSSWVLGLIRDPRAVQFWDRGRVLSRQMGEAATGEIVWDCVLIYPRGARWEAAPPKHVFLDGIVMDVMGEFRKTLRGALDGP